MEQVILSLQLGERGYMRGSHDVQDPGGEVQHGRRSGCLPRTTTIASKNGRDGSLPGCSSKTKQGAVDLEVLVTHSSEEQPITRLYLPHHDKRLRVARI